MPPSRSPASRRQSLAPATLSEADGVRYLHLDSPWVQGAMRLRKPAQLELEYIQRMMAALLLLPLPLSAPEPPATAQQGRVPEAAPEQAWAEREALQLGLGAASLTRFCLDTLGLRTTAVEINPSVIQACRLWFRLPPDHERLQVHEMDARDYLAQPPVQRRFSLVQVDLYDHEAAAPALDDLPFYQACASVIRPDGVLAINLFGRDAQFERSLSHLQQAFASGQVWALKPTREGNTIVLASPSPEAVPGPLLQERARFIEDNWGLPARKWLRIWPKTR
jgi:spermidine synthase